MPAPLDPDGHQGRRDHNLAFALRIARQDSKAPELSAKEWSVFPAKWEQNDKHRLKWLATDKISRITTPKLSARTTHAHNKVGPCSGILIG